MANEVPPQQIFDYMAALYNCITKYAAKQPLKLSNYQLGLFSLASKALTHVRESMYLQAKGSIGEAIIILRAAYEATVVFLYLLDKYLSKDETAFQKYVAFSHLVEHRNQLETFQIGKDEVDEAGRIEQQSKNESKRAEIIANGYHTLYNVTEDEVSDLRKLKKVVNRAHFMPFEDMRNSLNNKPETIGIAEVGFQTYNLASQIAHSHHIMTISLYTKEQAHPIYDELAICRQSIYMMTYTSKGLQRLNALKNGFTEEYGKLFLEALTAIRRSCGDNTPL